MTKTTRARTNMTGGTKMPRVLDSRAGTDRHRRCAAVLLLALGFTTSTGCSGLEPEAASGSDAASDASTSAEPAPEHATKAPTVPQAILDAAIDDAAKRASMERSAISVVSAAAVTWSDGSAGCPEPGMLYTQALVPG